MMNDGALADELASFRQEWHEELCDAVSSSSINTRNEEEAGNVNKSDEKKAIDLFLKAGRLEKEGDFNAAVFFYREAVRLYPEVESKISEYQSKDYNSEDDEGEEEQYDEDIDVSLEDISKHFSMLHITGLCSPELPQTGSHISALPTELLIVIIKWVVSKEIDTRSLNQLSLVCKWFYACARDEELWKLICIRTWGLSCSPLKSYGNSWRRMFHNKPHVRFDGVYISENTYVRIGEPGVDSFYKPFHLVVYYKYLRFFPDGKCAVYSSAEEPKQTIQTLKSRPYRDPHIYVGYYRMTSDDIISVFYTCETKPSKLEIQKKRRKNRDYVVDSREHNYYMHLSLSNTRKDKNNKLSWTSYVCKIKNNATGLVTDNEFDWDKFKPFIFSRVRSYTSSTTSCL